MCPPTQLQSSHNSTAPTVSTIGMRSDQRNQPADTMTATVDLTLIFPAYNECAAIERTLRSAQLYLDERGYSFQIIAVVDGSDGSREIVEQVVRGDPRFQILGSSERRGKGHAVRSAMAVARGEIIGFVDADDKTPIEEFDLIRLRFEEGYRVVIGSRGLAASTIERPQPWFRRAGSRTFGVLLHALIGLRDIPDTQCGFKFFRRDVALGLFAEQRIAGYMFDVEILCLARRNGHAIAQVPVRWRDDGDSRLRLLSGNARNALDILRIRWRLSRRKRTVLDLDRGTMSTR